MARYTQDSLGLYVGSKTVTTSGTAEAGPTVPVPDGIAVIVKPLATNTGAVYIGGTKAAAELNVALLPSNGYGLQISHLSDVWFDVAVNGEGVVFIFEQEHSTL